jgi:Bax protein
MKRQFFFRSTVILASIAVLIAPFTYLKPPSKIEDKKGTQVIVPKKIEQPLHDVQLPEFSKIRDVKEKKKEFFDFIRPAVVKENQRLLALRNDVDEIVSQLSLGEPLTAEKQKQLNELAKRYRVKTKLSPLQKATELYTRIDAIPTPLVLVQAANESAWGTSRFARIGLNFFGIWCYQEGCGMIPRSRNDGASHEVRAFSSVDEAVKRYLYNINTNNAYVVFRTIRKQLREQDLPLHPEVLATGLLPYSERGSDYVLELTEMLRHNKQYFGKPQSKPAKTAL